MYQRFPYPAYPLFVRLQWWQAYLSSMAFSRALVPKILAGVRRPRILLAGCGDTQPYIHRKLEPRQNIITACDIAARNLKRARARLLLESKPLEWHECDLLALPTALAEYSHIDCYGVLHHLANPTQGLIHLGKMLLAGGTMRLMVYNRESRDWIWHMRQIFRLLRLSYQRADDLRLGQLSLKIFARYHPALQQHLLAMGGSLSRRSRFVDTFFHAREARISLDEWFKAIELTGLKIMGQFDRFAELDDLPNPLWQPPCVKDLANKALDRRFEHNLEWYLYKPITGRISQQLAGEAGPSKHVIWQKFHLAPRLWTQYPETKKISRLILQQLWLAHLNFIHKRSSSHIDHLLAKLNEPSIQRFARIGVFFPAQIRDSALLKIATIPMEAETLAPDRIPAELSDPQLFAWIASLTNKRQQAPEIAKLIHGHLSKIK